MFTMTFVATQSGIINNMIHLTSKVTTAEAYTGANLETREVILTKRGSVEIEYTNALMQNEPNPFIDETTIGFELAEAGQATITILDVAGRVLKTIDTDGTRGYNEVKLSATDFGVTGVLYYQIESGEFTATRKMIIVE